MNKKESDQELRCYIIKVIKRLEISREHNQEPRSILIKKVHNSNSLDYSSYI
jgi:hypothetical protein